MKFKKPIVLPNINIYINIYTTIDNFKLYIFLIVFSAINMFIILLISDLFVNGIEFLREDFLLTKYNNFLDNENCYTSIYSPKTLIYIKQDLNNNKFYIFNTFIDLFDKNHSTFKYFPSYFQNLNWLGELKYNNNNNNINVIENVKYNQCFIREYYNNSYNNLLNDLYKIIMDIYEDTEL